MNNKILLLNKATPSKLVEVAVLSNAQKLTQTVKENEEIEEYVPNKRAR